MVHRRDKFDKEFYIVLISEREYEGSKVVKKAVKKRTISFNKYY